MITIEVSGFQSIDKTRVEIEGFTALVGRSNVGKSALIRAVKAALSNTTGTWFVRHGSSCTRRVKNTKTCKCQTTVHITMPGLDLIWEKGDAITSYTVNGKVMTAMERGVPDFMAEHGLAPIRIGDSASLLQVADQLAPLFLMTESGASVANVLSDVARLDAVNGASKLVEKDRREATSLRKTREKDVADLSQKLSVYDDLDNTETQVVSVEARHESIRGLETKASKLDVFIYTLATSAREVGRLQGVQALKVPAYEELEAKQLRALVVTNFHERFLERGRSVKTLSGVEDVPAPDMGPVIEKVAAVEKTAALQGRLTELVTVLKAAKGLEGLPEPNATPLEEKRDALRCLGGWAVRLDDLKEWASAVRSALAGETPKSERIATLASKKTAVDTILARQKILEDSVLALQMEIEAIDREDIALQTEIKSMGLKMCPTCARPMHADEHKDQRNGQIGVHFPD